MKRFIFLFFLCISLNLFAQKIKTTAAIAIADSILKAEVGERLFKYFKLNEHSSIAIKYHSFKDFDNKIVGTKFLPQNFDTLFFLYEFNNSVIDEINPYIELILDSNLKKINKFDLDFIPDFLIEDKPSNFISRRKALKIAKANFTKNNFTISTARLYFIKNEKKYIYEVVKNLAAYTDKTEHYKGDIEVIHINAITGKVEEKVIGFSGLISNRRTKN